jgi:hypothetical protein
MMAKTVLGWCNSKEEASYMLLTELRQLLQQARKKIEEIKENFQESRGHEEFRLSPKTVSKLNGIDTSLQKLLDSCLEIDRRG